MVGYVLSVQATSSLGVGDVTDRSTLNLYGDRNIGGGDCYGAATTSRLARLAMLPTSSAYFLSANPSVGSVSGSGNLYVSNTVLTVGADASSTIFDGFLNQCASSTGSLVKTGSGTLTFKGISYLASTTVVNGGSFVDGGSMAGGITVNSGATLAGAGSAGAVTLNNGAIFLPGNTVTNGAVTNSMTTLKASSLSFTSGATVTININGPTNYTQLVVNGPVNLGGATLQVNLNYRPDPADIFTIVLNTSSSGTTPAFAGLPENAFIDFGNGYRGHISYVGTGDATSGNDVKIFGVTRNAGSLLRIR